MHFEASVERHHQKRPSRSRSPLRSSLKRSSSYGAFPPSRSFAAGYSSSSTALAPAPAPAPAPWVRGTASAYHGSYAPQPSYPQYPPAPPRSHRHGHHNYPPQPPHNYHVPGAYPNAPSYLFQTPPAAAPDAPPALADYYPRPPSPKVAPLDDPEVQSVIEHERDMRLYSEQRHQETLKQQILDMEITKLAAQREAAREEAAARQRMHNLFMYSQQRAHEQERIIHEQDAIIRRARSGSRKRSRSRGREEQRAAIRQYHHDEAKRATHICGRCTRRGHYSAECGGALPGHLLEAPQQARSRRGSRAGSVYSYTEDERYTEVEYDDEEGWYSEDEELYAEERRGRRSRSVPADQGVLVVYAPGGGAGTVRSSVRHVVA
ncbi:hypothetical protein DFH27DRAFT_584252 [Peziza echinospora]|nr:hypothetical protein DFH27DRAFT_584252 [Peziza echinospora]